MLNVIQQASLCVQTMLSVLIFTSAVRPTIFQTVQRAQRRQTSTLQVRLRVLWCVEAGVVECLKGWRCVGGLEKCGVRGKVYCGRGEGECEKGGGMWEGVRCVGGLEECGGRGRV